MGRKTRWLRAEWISRSQLPKCTPRRKSADLCLNHLLAGVQAHHRIKTGQRFALSLRVNLYRSAGTDILSAPVYRQTAAAHVGLPIRAADCKGDLSGVELADARLMVPLSKQPRFYLRYLLVAQRQLNQAELTAHQPHLRRSKRLLPDCLNLSS